MEIKRKDAKLETNILGGGGGGGEGEEEEEEGSTFIFPVTREFTTTFEVVVGTNWLLEWRLLVFD